MQKVASGLKEEQKSRLESLGFKQVVEKDKKVGVLRRKLAIAYEHFRYVTQEKVDKFNAKLHKKTMNRQGDYKRLEFESISKTELVPPSDVLTLLEEAKKLDCFDEFEIGYIAEVKDPIVFGRVKGCANRFFIGQWDDDVRIEDILAPNEG